MVRTPIDDTMARALEVAARPSLQQITNINDKGIFNRWRRDPDLVQIGPHLQAGNTVLLQ